MKMSNEKNKEGYVNLRMGLLRRGLSIRSFALRFGYPVQTVYGAAKGIRAGKVSVPIRSHLERFINEP